MSKLDGNNIFERKGFLSFLVDAEMASTIREDLAYQRSRDRDEKGPLYAALRHAVRLAATIGPLIIYAISGGFIMIGNSIKMARRNLAKHKGFSFINIAGLALGMAACLFLVLWVQDELSFDGFHKNAADIFRVDAGGAITPYPLGPAAKQKYSGSRGRRPPDGTRDGGPAGRRKNVLRKSNLGRGSFVSPDLFLSPPPGKFRDGFGPASFPDPYGNSGQEIFRLGKPDGQDRDDERTV